MNAAQIELRDQLRYAKEGADNLARASGYRWSRWLEGSSGRCTAAFDRDGQTWSLTFTWTPREQLGALANNIERMDFLMKLAMKEFGALKAGAMMREAAETGVRQ